MLAVNSLKMCVGASFEISSTFVLMKYIHVMVSILMHKINLEQPKCFSLQYFEWFSNINGLDLTYFIFDIRRYSYALTEWNKTSLVFSWAYFS